MSVPRCLLSVVVAELLLVPGLRAADRSAADESAARDCRLTLRARQALQQDPLLARLALGVSVHAGSAVVWGAVPSVEVGRRAVERVRQVPGILRVRNEVQVLAPEDPLVEFLTRPPKPLPASPPVLPDALQGPTTLTSRWADGAAPLPSEASPRKPDLPPVTLMPPVTPPGASLPPQAVAKPAAPAAESLLTQVEQLRRADARFQGVQIEVTGGVVRLRGSVPRAEDGMELARKIAQLPGVERVILREVRNSADP